jgi:hypothetical protein
MNPYIVDLFPFTKAINEAGEFLKRYAGKELVHLSDVDADGLVSAYGIDLIASHMGSKVNRIFLERPFENVIEHVYRRTTGPVIFTDHGGGHEKMIARIAGDRPTIVIDHHQTSKPCLETTLPRNFRCLNSNCWGVDGERLASASTITYLLARHINPNVQTRSHLFLVGAIGDGNHRRGGGQFIPNGIDALCMADVEKDDFSYNFNNPKPHRRYLVRLADGEVRNAAKLAHDLTSVGCVNYMDSGPELGLQVLHMGAGKTGNIVIGNNTMQQSTGVSHLLRNLECKMQERFEAERDKLLEHKTPSHATANTIYFNVGEAFSDLGLKIIGDFAHYMIDHAEHNPRRTQFIPDCAYVLAAMPVRDIIILGEKVPAFKDLKPRLKVSVRATEELRDRITPKDKSTIPSAPRVCDLVREFMPLGENCHDERGAGIVLETEASGLAQRIQEYLDITMNKR